MSLTSPHLFTQRYAAILSILVKVGNIEIPAPASQTRCSAPELHPEFFLSGHLGCFLGRIHIGDDAEQIVLMNPAGDL
jgi:predicted deacylase